MTLPSFVATDGLHASLDLKHADLGIDSAREIALEQLKRALSNTLKHHAYYARGDFILRCEYADTVLKRLSNQVGLSYPIA